MLTQAGAGIAASRLSRSRRGAAFQSNLGMTRSSSNPGVIRIRSPVIHGIIALFMDLTLPFDYAAIERILPHRYPFLLVDRITEFEVDKRIVGIKNVSRNERYLSHGEPPVLPPTILTEAVAQVG